MTTDTPTRGPKMRRHDLIAKLRETETLEMVRLYAMGLSVPRVARQVGRSRYCTRTRLIEAGIKIRGIPPERIAPSGLEVAIMRGIALGLRPHQIADRERVSISMVLRRLPKARRKLIRVGAEALGLLTAEKLDE